MYLHNWWLISQWDEGEEAETSKQRKCNGTNAFIERRFKFRNKETFSYKQFKRWIRKRLNRKLVKRNRAASFSGLIKNTWRIWMKLVSFGPSRNPYVFRDTRVQMTACLPCSAPSTLKFLNHKRSQKLGSPVTEGKEISYALVRLEDDAKVNLRKARRDELDKFGANFL